MRGKGSSDLLAGAVAALVTLLLVSLAYAQAWPLIVDVGENDHWLVAGFHDPEQGAIGSFRWTDGDSQIFLPRPTLRRSVLLTVRVIDPRATPTAPRDVIIRTDGAVLAQIRIDHGQLRDYELLVPVDTKLFQSIKVRLISDVTLEHEDGRELGVALKRIAIMPSGDGPLLPSPWLMLHAMLFGVLSYTAGRLAGAKQAVALLITGGFTLLLALLVGFKPLDTLPYIHRFTLLALVFCFGGGIIRFLLLPAPNQQQTTVLLPGRYLPIVLATCAWFALLFQYIMIWDGASGIGSPTWMRATGLSLAVGGLGLWGWRTWQDRNLSLVEQREQRARPLLIMLAVAAALQIAMSLEFAFSRQAPDFLILYRGARDWVAGGSFYDLEAVVTNHFGHVFKVPPFYGMFFVPLVYGVDEERSLLLHRIMNTLLIAATALAWLRMWRIPLFSFTAMGLLLILDFRPLFDTIAFGQIDIVLLFLLTLALWALREERDGLAGVLVALGTLFKIYPVILLAFFVLKQRWRALIGFGLGMLIFNGIAVTLVGWEEHRIYLFEVVPKIGGTTSWVENQTISGFMARLAAPPTAASIFRDPLLQMVGTVISGLFVLAALALTLRPASSQRTRFALQYGLFLLLMVLTVPAAWMHYQTLLLVPFATLLLHFRERQVPLGFALLLGISFALIAFGNQWSFYDRSVSGFISVLGVSYKLYGMLLLAGLLGFTIMEAGSREQEIESRK
ncbi:glycosyltransferase family 87 protein [Candidatus Viridilinea mediisalina]|nr:glycosyltransferase family 87 protein [Candidatus Viridilinea mediisalina]